MFRPQFVNKEKVRKSLFVIVTWIYLLYFLIPIWSYFLILDYYTPQPFHLSLEVICESDVRCKLQLDDQAIEKSKKDIQEQIAQASRIDEFSKPFGGFIRLNPQVTNKSTFETSISDPARDILHKASFFCQLPQYGVVTLSYNSGIFFSDKDSLANTPNLIKQVANTLLSCFSGFQSEKSDSGLFVIAPNSTISLKDPKMDFLVEFVPDYMSKFLVGLEVVAVFLALLPLLREGIKYIVRGWRYFLD